eukprot:4476202-Amphidinium_carterae.1
MSAQILQPLQQSLGKGLVPTAQVRELLTDVLKFSSTDSEQVVAILDPNSRGVTVAELVTWLYDGNEHDEAATSNAGGTAPQLGADAEAGGHGKKEEKELEKLEVEARGVQCMELEETLKVQLRAVRTSLHEMEHLGCKGQPEIKKFRQRVQDMLEH